MPHMSYAPGSFTESHPNCRCPVRVRLVVSQWEVVVVVFAFTASEKIDLVEEYMALPQGGKAAWRLQMGVSSGTMSNWRRAYLFGDLARDLVPRDTAGMDVNKDRTPGLAQRLQQRVDQEARVSELEARVAELTAANAQLSQANDVLGKAIGLLHAMSEDSHEPVND